ncbi:hypothetical protein BESB_013940 [Besnoitia besnoiti]|uniref:Uncharacterized protein n=1 Tax=Besnoitia besnoiti TaxID=94643 RepID=A0A2A9MBL5_BESBE|nr:hypothetical protein BESB_013940 [Besnoitia besnoiti]PFH32782.1 hypothetical protein BESB_013940 [Besnoitia besnoiti]
MSQGRSLDMQKCHVFHSVSSGEAARARGSDTTASFGATQWGVTPLRGASGCAWKKTGSQTFVEGSVSSRKAPRDGADIKKRGDRGHYSAYDGPRKRELPEAAPSDKVWLRCSRNDCDSVSGSGDEGRGSSAGAIRSDGSSPVATATGGVGYVGSIRAAASEHLSLLTKCPPLWPALLRLTSKPRQDEKVVCRELQVLTLLRQAASSMTKDVEELPPLCRAHIHVAHFMEDDVLVALAQHPLQDEALHLKWRGIATRPLLVHASLEITNDDVCGSVAGRGASLKVYDIALAVTGSFAALRLKCAEGWITAECVDMSAWQGCCQCRRRNFCHMWTREIEWERRDEECCKPLWGSRIRASRGPRRVPHTTVAAKSCHRKQPPGAADAVDVARREASGRRNDATRKSGPRAMLTAVGVDFEGSVEADEEDRTEKECGRQLLVGAQRRTHRKAVGSFLRLRSGTRKSLSVSSDSETARNRRSRTLPDGHGHEKPETVGRVRDNWDDGSPQKFRQTSEDEERECSETAASSRRLVSQLLGCGAACSVALGVPTGGRLSGCRIFNRRRRSVSTVRRRESSNPVQAIRVKERKCSSSSIRSETASERGCVAGFARKGRRCGQPPTRHRDAGSVGVRDIRRLRKTCGQKGGLHGACRLLTREVVQVWARAEEGWYRTDDEARVQFPNGQPEWWKDAGIWGNYRRHNSSCYLHDCEGSQEITLGNSSGASSQSSEQQCWCHRRCSRLVERWCRGPTKRTLNSCSAFDAAPYNRRQMCKQGRIRRFTCGNEPLPSLHGDSSGEQEGHEISTSSTTTAALGRGLMSDDEVRDLSRSQQSSSGVGNRSNHRSPGKIGVTLPAGNAGGITPWLPAVSDGLRGDPGASVKASTLGTHRQGEEAPRPFRQRWLLYRVCGRNTVPVGCVTLSNYRVPIL